MNEDHIPAESPEYLLDKLARAEEIFSHEVILVAEHNKGYDWPGEMHTLLMGALTRTLKAKPGPQRRRSDHEWRNIQAAVEFRTADLWDMRRDSGKRAIRGALSPRAQALEDVARQRKMGSGDTLRNALSARNLL